MVDWYSNTKYLTVLDPIGQENVGWELRALSPTDYATVLAYVPRFTEMMFSKSANDFGAGSVTLDSDDRILHDPLPLGLPGTILDYECLWQVYQDGVLRGEWLGQDTQEDIVTEDGSLITKVAGQSTEGVLTWGVAVPGIVSRMLPDPKDKKPKSWSSNYRVFSARRQSNTVRLWITSGHGVKAGWPIYVYDLHSDLNGHATVTARGKNWIEFSKSGSNIAKFDDANAQVQIHPSDDDPKKPAEWEAQLIPTDIVDPMEFEDQPAIKSFLWLMNQNIVPRGTLDFVTLMFDASTDSEGQPWADVSDVQISPGETPLALLQRLSAAFGWEFKMLPGFRLFLSQDGFGAHKEGQVKHFIAGTQLQHGRSGTTREIANRVYAQAQNGAIASAFGSSDVTPRQREAWLDAGDAKGASGASRVANSSLALLRNKAVGRTIQVEDGQPTRSLFTDYDVQDWIAVEDEKFSPHAVKVVAATITVDADALVSTELTIQTRFEARQVRIQKTLDKMGASAGGSQTAKPITGKQSVANSKLSDLVDVNARAADDGDILQFDGSQWSARGADTLIADVSVDLGELTDVDLETAAPTDGQVLVYDADTGLWVPATNEAVVPGLPKDRRWTVGSSETSVDEFNDGSIDGAWSRVDGTGALATSLNWVEGGDVLSAEHTSAADSSNYLHALLRPLSSAGGAMSPGDAFITAFTLFGDPDTNYTMGGLILSTSPTFGSGTQVFNLHFSSSSSGKATSDLRVTNNFNSASGGVAAARDVPGNGMLRYTRLVMVTTSTWRLDVSPDGVGWMLGTGTITWNNVPTHVGFLSSNWGQSTPSVASYEFIRRVAGVS